MSSTPYSSLSNGGTGPTMTKSGGPPLSYSAREEQQAREALAVSGYPNPSQEDIERVLQHVWLNKLKQAEHEARRSSSNSSSQSTRHHSRARATTATTKTTSATPSGLRHSSQGRSSRAGRTASVTPSTRMRRRAEWDPDTHVEHPRVMGPRFPASRSSPPGQEEDEAEVRRRQHARAMHNVPPHYRQRAPPMPEQRPYFSPLGGEEEQQVMHPSMYLNPAVRLERYIRRYERALGGFYARHKIGSSAPQSQQQQQQASSSSLRRDHHDSNLYDAHLGGEELYEDDEEAERGWARMGQEDADNYHPYRGQHHQDVGHDVEYEEGGYGISPAGAAPVAVGETHASRALQMPLQHTRPITLRRTANVVFNITGDQRYRFRPTTSAPAGANVPQRAFSNLYNTQPASRRTGGLAPSTYGVSYLQPDGSTLKHKADPVKRGQQMRALWQRDKFLTQRDRPKEMWRTRQITMAYEEDPVL